MSKSTKSTVTAGDLRDYFNADPKRMAALSAEARHTVEKVEGKSPRGQVHPEAIKFHNQRRKVQYVRGASAVARDAAKTAALSLREQAIAAGVAKPGSRGPLPKAFIASLKG